MSRPLPKELYQTACPPAHCYFIYRYVFIKLYIKSSNMNYFEALGRNLISHGFDFDKLLFFPAIPLMRPDALILSVR